MIGQRRSLDPDAPPESPRPPVRTEVDPATGRAFGALSLVVLVSGVLVAAAISWWQPFEFDSQLLMTGPLLVGGFLLAEQLTIDVDVNRVGWTISFTEIPLVLGLLTAPFEVVLGAHLIAGLGAQVGRRESTHVAYNAGVMCLEIAIPFAVLATVREVLGGIGPVWSGEVVGTLTSPLVSCACALAALHVLGGTLRASGAVRLGVRTLVVGVLNTGVGLVGHEVAVHTPWGWALVALVSAALVGLYRAYSGLLREQRDLETLSDVSLSVARSGQDAARRPSSATSPEISADTAEWQPVAERIREQLNARRVVLRRWLEPGEAAQALVAGEELPERARGDATREDPLLQLPGSHVRYFRSLEAPDEVRRALRERGAYEALVVPLRGTNQLLGVVEAHDRISRWRGFGRSDLRLLRTLASHLATAMDNRRLLARLRHDAYHDPLTGLLNRPGFREVTGEVLDRESGVVALRVDLDLLTTVSEALGHAWEDRMVAAAGRRMSETLGTRASLARLEGGAFAVLLTGHTEAEAHEVAEQLRSVVAEPYPVDKLVVEASAVVGYAHAEQVTVEPPGGNGPAGGAGPAATSAVGADAGEELDADTLLQRADVAVRAARGGEDGVRGYAPSMGQIFLRRFQLVTQFRQALDSGQVEVHYQPKVALPGRELIGAEALVRWSHPEYGRLDPDEFVPAVEATGLVDALTSFVMEQALLRVRDWLDRGLRMSAAVNLSVRNLADEQFPDRVAEALERNGVPPELLTFELTESSVMADPERALPVLRRLHTFGVVLAVDDFGTGYSSLAYLRQLPVDEVKIDKSFVLGMGTDLGDMAVVRSIVDLGHSLGLGVVAEGVEDDAAREQLVNMGCDVAQGYLISRPLSEDRFEAWVQARTIPVRGNRDETVLTLLH